MVVNTRRQPNLITNDDDLLPAFSKDLIEQLDKRFPHRCPDKRMDEREIWIYKGKRELIDHLLSRLEYTEEYGYGEQLKEY